MLGDWEPSTKSEEKALAAVMDTMVYPMGVGVSRLYSSLTQTLSSSSPLPLPLLEPRLPLGTNLDPDFCKEQASSDPEELLRQCEEALADGPLRFQRKFTCLNDGDCASSSVIRVMQWNVLAQALGEGLDCFVQCPPEAISWSRRKFLILEEILTYRPHVLCLQEVDHYYDTLQPVLSSLGYGSSFCPKPWSPCLAVEGNNGPDGCALFYDQTRFQLLDGASVQLSAMRIPTNQVALLSMLQCRLTGACVCVAVTHLKARSGWEWLRSAQGSDLLRHIHALVQKHSVNSSHVPLLVCGDFNATPNEEVYRRFATSALGLDSAYKMLSRDCSAEPDYTTWKIRPSGECCTTLDYIWYSRDSLRVDAVLELPTEEQIGLNRLPSFSYPSDHLSLVCEFSLKEE